MATEILPISRQMPEWEAVSAAARVIDSGGVICFPTDTVYGFAASIYCDDALARLRALKTRRSEEPFVIIASDMGVVRELATGVTARHRKLIDTYWPGPLTIVFGASDLVPEGVVGHSKTVALRVPDDILTQSILRACGMPLAAPSANIKGKRPAVCPEDVLEHFDGKIDLLLDGGLIESSEPSTIVKVGGRKLEVLRPGRVSLGKM
ncbi:L-threonylcarbamoyladenylate synthase [Candidatus Eisenbacteria bacterium]|uniref:L-threonylcarbamoyladenylate synthase n=1 Tax=Eiseniibacteriota bacterium TaxID=2212470 RepID=A0ABV6YQD5_UNCEI